MNSPDSPLQPRRIDLLEGIETRGRSIRNFPSRNCSTRKGGTTGVRRPLRHPHLLAGYQVHDIGGHRALPAGPSERQLSTSYRASGSASFDDLGNSGGVEREVAATGRGEPPGPGSVVVVSITSQAPELRPGRFESLDLSPINRTAMLRQPASSFAANSAAKPGAPVPKMANLESGAG